MWYVSKNGQPNGFIEERDIAAGLAQGLYGGQTMAWRAGWSQWVPITSSELAKYIPRQGLPSVNTMPTEPQQARTPPFAGLGNGSAKVILGFVVFIVAAVMLSRFTRQDSTESTTPTQATRSKPAPHDDLSLFTSKFGEPDHVKSSEDEVPRPPIVTRQLIYAKENVRVVYVVNSEVGAPPYSKWKLIGFQHNRSNAVLTPGAAVARLKSRQR